MRQYDFLVIGSGIAGLSFALDAAEKGRVAVVTKKERGESNTNYAQGGIACVLSDEDSFEEHYRDTLEAGAGLCHGEIVDLVVKNGPAAIKSLIERGVHFSKSDDSAYDLGREGGHSKRRILHAKDATGREVERALLECAKANPNIAFFDNHYGVDLLVHHPFEGSPACFGAYVLHEDGVIEPFTAKATLLATGGAGKVYLYTSNPDIASGDGVAMAYRAGADVGNMEFMQFHPTCLYHPYAKNFLISEAVRGEGGVLRLPNGKTFMESYHEMGCLAPRDVVARAIDAEIKKGGFDSALLDITHRDADFIKERFPGIYSKCLEFDIDITKEPIPVVPAAHYMCGGILTDAVGHTSLKGLFAVGECACTGLHGANRLASNSLLEAVVYSARASEAAIAMALSLEDAALPSPDPWDASDTTDSDEEVVITQNWDEIRRFMWNYVGIVRSDKRLERARKRINLLMEEIEEYYYNFTVTPSLVELRNLALVALLIIRCAQSRKESRGLHYNIDHPERDDARFRHDTVIRKGVL
ncbi:MAG: L-aspartate oxidase [Deltaproteobacteria bacterium]|nr:MAG: L-aspartate oxidase [Deltaproteobacteria bacterium]